MNNPLIYICSPYRGDVENNIQKAKNYCRFVVEEGKCPLAPHLFFPQFLDDNIESERQQGLQLNSNFLNLCDELWVFGEEISQGMQFEIDLAKYLNKKIIFFDEELNIIQKLNFKDLSL